MFLTSTGIPRGAFPVLPRPIGAGAARPLRWHRDHDIGGTQAPFVDLIAFGRSDRSPLNLSRAPPVGSLVGPREPTGGSGARVPRSWPITRRFASGRVPGETPPRSG